MKLLDQPDNSHHAFKFNKESMVMLLWGHGNQIPGCLKKNYKLQRACQGGWKHQPHPHQCCV